MKLLACEELKKINGGCICYIIKHFRQISSFIYSLFM